MAIDNGVSKIKQDDLEAIALASGRKLGFLLAASALPGKTKDALIDLIKDMTINRQSRLLESLEAQYLNEQTAGAEKDLKKELESLVKKYQAEDEAQAKRLAAAINKI
jgi:hypothetical protein